MVSALMIAAGGGGDAITAAVLGPFLGLTGDRPVVMTYAWDRLLIDPLPGPRSAADFEGLQELAPDVLEILPTTKPIPPAGSTLPRLAAELPARLLLLDPVGGAIGVARQVAAAAEHFGCDQLALVDVGGDALTDGKDEGLRSPLADLLTVAACSLVGLPAELLVPGPGVDGELPESVVLDRVANLGGGRRGVLDAAAVEGVAIVFSWHPSEASGLVAVAARGARGLVEVRDSGSPVPLGKATSEVYAIGLQAVMTIGPASRILKTSTLREVRSLLTELTGVDEIGYEVRKSESLGLADSREPGAADLERVDSFAADASNRGVSFVSFRRLAELLNIRGPQQVAQLRSLLARKRTSNYMPPVYRL